MKVILVDAVFCFIIKKDDGKFGIFKDMYELLEKYENKKIILTGANNEKFEEYELNKMPYEVFTLQHNPEKSNPEYFDIFLHKNNLTAKDVIYFEHDLAAINSANSVGINTHHYDESKQDLHALKNFLDQASLDD